jgi:hypothetical protein
MKLIVPKLKNKNSIRQTGQKEKIIAITKEDHHGAAI